MKIVNNIGVVLVSLYFIFLGAYYVIYAKILYTALGLTACGGADCLTFTFMKVLAVILGVVGFAYVFLAIVIRFHRAGCHLALVACLFNIVLMAAYLLRPEMFALWLSFVFPIKIVLERVFQYAPSQTNALLPSLETGIEVFMILINIVIAAYLLRCLGREVWGPAEKEDEDEDDDDEPSEDELKEAVREVRKK